MAKARINKKACFVVILILTLVIFGALLTYTKHKPLSPELIELRQQLSVLQIPTGGDFSQGDSGCVYDSWDDETRCYRSLSVRYDNANLRQTGSLNKTLIMNGWKYRNSESESHLSINDLAQGKVPGEETESHYYFSKIQYGHPLCADIFVAGHGWYKNPYKPYMILHIFGKTEHCST